MTEETQTNPEKSTSEELDAILPLLNTNQLRFIVARQECASDKEAAEAIDIEPDTVYHWPPFVKQAVKLMAGDGVHVAKELRRRSLPKAMAVKVAGLDSEDEKIRQTVSTEIIEWELGKAVDRKEFSGKDGKPLNMIIYLPDNGRSDDEPGGNSHD